MLRSAMVLLCSAFSVPAYGTDGLPSVSFEVARKHHHEYVLEQHTCTARTYRHARNQLAVLDASGVIYQRSAVAAGLDEFSTYLQSALDPRLDCAGMHLAVAADDREMIALRLQRVLNLPSAGWQGQVGEACSAMPGGKASAFADLVRIGAATHLWNLVAEVCAPVQESHSRDGLGH